MAGSHQVFVDAFGGSSLPASRDLKLTKLRKVGRPRKKVGSFWFPLKGNNVCVGRSGRSKTSGCALQLPGPFDPQKPNLWLLICFYWAHTKVLALDW